MFFQWKIRKMKGVERGDRTPVCGSAVRHIASVLSRLYLSATIRYIKRFSTIVQTKRVKNCINGRIKENHHITRQYAL